ncbi:hypothetical protein COY28_02720, partial [Candidatus Woesearchaeota archaeon CG_4_10_14_0_2_um_filter_57_5]
RNSSTVFVNVTVNTAPTLNVTIVPASPTQESQLNCSFTVSDADSDTVSANVTWLNGSSAYTASDASFGPVALGTWLNNGTGAIPANTTRKGQDWTCVVTVEDGTIAVSANASTTIGNTAPTLTNTTGILPDNANTTDALSYSLMASDLDGDALTLRVNWTGDDGQLYEENLTIAAGSTPASSQSVTVNLSSTNTTPGMNITLRIMGTDGTDNSNALQAMASIRSANTPPVIDSTSPGEGFINSQENNT